MNYPLDEYGFEKYEDNEFPLAYLITIRTFGTWLHGDERYSVDRHGKNVYGTDRIAPNQELREAVKANMKSPVFILSAEQRPNVEIAIKEVCQERG